MLILTLTVILINKNTQRVDNRFVKCYFWCEPVHIWFGVMGKNVICPNDLYNPDPEMDHLD